MIEYLRTTENNLLLFLAGFKRRKELEADIKKRTYEETLIANVQLANPYKDRNMEELTTEEIARACKIVEFNLSLNEIALSELNKKSKQIQSDTDRKFNLIDEKRKLTLKLIDFAIYIGIDPMAVHNEVLAYEGENQFEEMSTNDMINEMTKAMEKPKPLRKIPIEIEQIRQPRR